MTAWWIAPTSRKPSRVPAMTLSYGAIQTRHRRSAAHACGTSYGGPACSTARRPPLPSLRPSVRQRPALLRGLMDSDGYADPVKGTVEFSSTDKPLADAVFELAASLGQKPALATKRATLYGKDCGPAHRVTWRPTVQVFTLPRKADRLAFDGDQSLRNHHRMIVSAERIPAAPMRCLTVSSPNAMFLVGRSMIPTHNTRASAEWVRSEMESGRRRQMGIIGPTADAVRRIMIEGPSGILAVCPPWNR